MYYKRRLLAIAYNWMDRYIALRYKGLGAVEVEDNNIEQSTSKICILIKLLVARTNYIKLIL